MLLTKSYIKARGTEEIIVGNKYYLGEIVNGDEDLDEIIDSCCIAIEDDEIVEFKVIDLDSDNLLDSLVVIKEIY